MWISLFKFEVLLILLSFDHLSSESLGPSWIKKKKKSSKKTFVVTWKYTAILIWRKYFTNKRPKISFSGAFEIMICEPSLEIKINIYVG